MSVRVGDKANCKEDGEERRRTFDSVETGATPCARPPEGLLGT
jgi:hypothetical protein